MKRKRYRYFISYVFQAAIDSQLRFDCLDVVVDKKITTSRQLLNALMESVEKRIGKVPGKFTPLFWRLFIE